MGHKKIFTKVMSVVLTMVMILTMIPSMAMTAKATETDPPSGVKVYFKIPDGTAATDWGVNAWGTGVTVEGDSENAFKPAGWGNTIQALLTEDALEGWGYVTLTGTVDGMQFVKKDGTEYKCWNTTIAKDGLTEAYFDPADEKWYTSKDKTTEIKAAEIRNIFILAGDSGLAGSDWDKLDTKNTLVNKEGTTQYSITFKGVLAETYGYKILQDPENNGWDKPFGTSDNRTVKVKAPADVTFTIDTEDAEKNVIVEQKLIKTLVVKNDNIVKGQAVALQTAAKYYDGTSATPEDVNVTYTLKTPTEGITLEDNKVTVVKTVDVTEVVVIATYGDFSKEFTIPVVDKEYTVNINMYSQELEMTPGVSDIYIFEKGGSRNDIMNLTGTIEDEDNGVTWVTGTIKVPFNSLGIIARDVAGSWDDGKDKDEFYVIEEDATEVTLWYEYGKTPTTEKPTITKTAPRYFYLEYENKTITDTPQFYSWTTGYKAERIDFENQGEGKWLIKVPVKPTCTKVDFVTVLDGNGDPWVKDGGDHSISFPLDQTVVCASMKEGQEPELSAPYNVGYELQPKDEQIAFYYRDDEALVEGTLAELNPTVEVNGEEKQMTYKEAEKRFVYVMDGLTDGRIYYRYHVGEEYILDKYNPNTENQNEIEYSYVDYYKLNAEITAEVMNASFNYNENNVVKFDVNQTKAEGHPDLEVEKASIDVSSLGGSKELAIEPELQAVAISVTTDTKLGKKTLPIVVTDQFGNEYTTTVDVTVSERKKAENDFDWDEACIYFMVTDRFFDGNAANNTASDKDLADDAVATTTYDKDDQGLYHGGDFAGVTAKLDYLKDLGINTIWITPIVENIAGVNVTGTGSDDVPYNAAYHGYWASDFTKLNPTLGTEAEFKTLIDEAHSRGIKIMVDIVVNHAGYNTNFGGMIRSGEDVVSGDDQKDSLSNLPDFKTEDASVRAQLVEWQTQWMKDYGIDYYRVDTVKHVEGTTWAALKNSVTEVNPSFKMIGEYSGAGYASNGGSLGTGQMDSDLDFDFNDQATNFVSGNIKAVESFMAGRNAALNNTYLTGQFLGSHDEIGFKQNLISNKKMTEEAATAAALVAATLQITAKGQPVIYYGEELGQTGENNYPYQTNRYDLDWTKATDGNVTYQHYKKLLAIRQSYVDIFARGDRKVIALDDEKGYDIVKRSYGNDSLLVGMNIKNENQTVTISGCDAKATYKDLYSGKTYEADSDGKIEIVLPKSSDGGTVILAKSTAVQPTPNPTPDPTPTPNPTPTPDPTPDPSTPDQKDVKVSKITVSGASKTIAAGKKITLTAEVSPADATNKAVTWTSSNTKYATVNSKGVVTTKSKGAGKTVTITATAADGSGVKADYKIKIVKDKVKSIKLKASNKSVKAGEKVTVKATVKTTGKTANKTLKWSSSNTKYATVNSKGVVTTKKAGKGKTVKITAKATDGTGKKATIKIKIKK